MTSSLLLSSLLTVEQCLERVTAADVAAVEDFASLSRRREYLTWRVMLYEHLGRKVEIEYADSAPIVVGENIYRCFAYCRYGGGGGQSKPLRGGY